jgi:hypothetical protein
MLGKWSILFNLAGDIFVLKLAWKGYKMTIKPQEKMFETLGDYKLRIKTGYGLIFFCVVAIVLNHVFL